MSLYNMLSGINPLTFLLTPMLFDCHASTLPRFRDCFAQTGEDEPKFDKDIILIYTRVGGGNRGEGYGEEVLLKHPNFLTTYDDSFDSTYGNYVFSVPEEFKDDYKKVIERKASDVSLKLQKKCREIYPKLNEKLWDVIWKTEELKKEKEHELNS